MGGYEDIWYTSTDGLRLYARDYVNVNAPATVLCLHGLTRSSADFTDFCEALAPEFRLIAVDQRGRGRSEWDRDASRYAPLTYVQDMFHLIDTLDLEGVILVGTSLGGMMSLLMNAMRPGRFAGVVLNDVGPVFDPVGIARIQGYVGKSSPVRSWADAIAQTRATNGIAFPGYDDADWERFARRLYGEDEQGVPKLLYDPAISEPMDEDIGNVILPDLWPAFDALAGVPALLIRGAISDILSSETAAEMKRRKPDLAYFEVADVGHAPMLDEPWVIPAIRSFLERASAAAA